MASILKIRSPRPEAYTVIEVAVMMGFHQDTVRTLFENEGGVIVITRPEKMHKRRYRSIRIPAAVYERVLRRIVVKR